MFFICLSGILFIYSCKEKEPPPVNSLQWLSIGEGLKYENKEGKSYLVQIVNDSCKWCDIMDENCFSHPELISYLHTRYIPIKFNILYSDTLEFQGKNYAIKTIGRTKIHSLADEWLHYWYFYPTTILMDKDFNRITKFSGYKDPTAFLMELKKM